MGMYNTDESIRSFAHSSFQVNGFLPLSLSNTTTLGLELLNQSAFVISGSFTEKMASIPVYEEYHFETLRWSFQRHFRRSFSEVFENVFFFLHV